MPWFGFWRFAVGPGTYRLNESGGDIGRVLASVPKEAAKSILGDSRVMKDKKHRFSQENAVLDKSRIQWIRPGFIFKHIQKFFACCLDMNLRNEK